jgi:hypothetical protein
MPLFRELPGRPRRSFSSLTTFLGGILGFLADAYVRAVVRVRVRQNLGAGKRKEVVTRLAARQKAGVQEEKGRARRPGGGVMMQ